LIVCRRCRQQKPELERAPVPGAWGPRIVAQTCADCWREWVDEQTRVINHERLQPADPAARQILYQRMADFLKLSEESV
jgi:Fe-S cluster biosynthesis and repair protein YggX